MKAIRTRYHGPTDTRGSRITADDGDGNRVSIPYPHELSGDAVHFAAVQALLDKMKWNAEVVGGGYGDAMYWVFTGRGVVVNGEQFPIGYSLAAAEYEQATRREDPLGGHTLGAATCPQCQLAASQPRAPYAPYSGVSRD